MTLRIWESNLITIFDVAGNSKVDTLLFKYLFEHSDEQTRLISVSLTLFRTKEEMQRKSNTIEGQDNTQ